MSVNKTKKREQSDKGVVVSDFFANVRCTMDESLSDFKEPLKNLKVLKNKKTTSKAPAKKISKKIKGQKDIRTALKSKKNELVEYTKDFNNICQKSGIDVDSEQLQLAIALSKSLQDSENKDIERESSAKPLSSVQRSGKIRITLEEYGFKVPELKISNRKRKKCVQNSKLLLMSVEEKQQIIADKYSQIIFENTSDISYTCPNNNFSESTLFNLNTRPYSSYKDLENFYINGLLEASPNSVGSLLRDWANIPGRPQSPTPVKVHEHDVLNFDFTEDEMDVILSGCLKSAQDCVCKKVDLIELTHEDICIKHNKGRNRNDVNSPENEEQIANRSNNASQSECYEIIHDASKSTEHSKSKLQNSESIRSASPDLFEDDVSSVMEVSAEIIPASQDTPSVAINLPSMLQKTQCNQECTKRKSNDFMDLTECVNNVQKIATVTINNTQRKSNDFMEITECINKSERADVVATEDNVDLTQSFDNDTIIILNDYEKGEHMQYDLTQCSSETNEEDNTLPAVHISGTDNDSGKNTIGEGIESSNTVEPETTVIEQDIVKDTEDNLALEHKSSISSKESNTFECFDFDHSEEDSIKRVANVTNEDSNKIIDLTQPQNSPEESQSQPVIDTKNLGKKDDVSIDYDDIFDNYDIDHESISEHGHNLSIMSTKDDQGIATTKVDEDISTKYDLDREIPLSASQATVPSQSAASDIFEISDEELNYSVHKSKVNLDLSHNCDILEKTAEERITEDANTEIIQNEDIIYEDFLPEHDPNYVFGGISMIDNAQLNVSNEIPSCSFNQRDSFLPVAEIKGTKVKIKSPLKLPYSDSSTPLRKMCLKDYETVKTPTNNEYIIKTTQVTPMVDYASLSTPERNRELEKYGLKPFKRKRAIQLLTHLYEQTHPVVEVCNDDTSPLSKKPKSQSDVVISSEKDPSTNHSVKENSQQVEQRKTRSLTKKNVIVDTLEKNAEVMHDITNRPVVKNIECGPEDWVFQKREKAKVHSCRVPLHIAFHNLVFSSKSLRESILRYEPVNIDFIHRSLVNEGHRYDPKDLLMFLDKKCITVKTADNNSRNNKRNQPKS